jgi:hypothetical protein
MVDYPTGVGNKQRINPVSYGRMGNVLCLWREQDKPKRNKEHETPLHISWNKEKDVQ